MTTTALSRVTDYDDDSLGPTTFVFRFDTRYFLGTTTVVFIPLFGYKKRITDCCIQTICNNSQIIKSLVLERPHIQLTFSRGKEYTRPERVQPDRSNEKKRLISAPSRFNN